MRGKKNDCIPLFTQALTDESMMYTDASKCSVVRVWFGFRCRMMVACCYYNIMLSLWHHSACSYIYRWRMQHPIRALTFFLLNFHQLTQQQDFCVVWGENTFSLCHWMTFGLFVCSSPPWRFDQRPVSLSADQWAPSSHDCFWGSIIILS